MNHNSFPGANSGEQDSTGQSEGNTTEFPSFEKHMQKLRQEMGSAEVADMMHANNEALGNQKSMKEDVVPDGMSEALSPIHRDIKNKIQNGENINGEEFIALAEDRFSELGVPELKTEGLAEYLSECGIDDGQDFDIMLPGNIRNEDGTISGRTPLSVSFKNKQGDYTRINLSADDSGKINGTSFSSNDEASGVRVGHKGMTSMSAPTRNRTSFANGQIVKIDSNL